MNASLVWKARPIFISSTFRDMQAERDYLRSHVFPRLKERLKADPELKSRVHGYSAGWDANGMRNADFGLRNSEGGVKIEKRGARTGCGMRPVSGRGSRKITGRRRQG